MCVALTKLTNQAASRKIRQEELRFGQACGAGKRFCSEVSAPNRTFHGGWPPSGRPVPSEKNSRPHSLRARTVLVHAGLRGIGRMNLLDDRGFQQLRVACSRKELHELL